MHHPLTKTIVPLTLALKILGSNSFTCSERLTQPQGRSGNRCRHEATTRLPDKAFTLSSRLQAMGSDDNEEDDGWGFSSSKSDQERELAALQAERAERSAPASSSASGNRGSQDNDPPERDLFIPIFALVSLGGLFGSYGYEMLRLYSRGELYLPWDQ